MKDMLELSAHLPQAAFATGATVAKGGGAPGGLWVLVPGALEVRKGGVLVNTITRPNASTSSPPTVPT